MNIQVFNIVTNIIGFTMAGLVIVGALLQRIGIKTPFRPYRANERPHAVGANLLVGVGLAMGTAARIPTHHQQVWILVLLLPGLCFFSAGWVLNIRSLSKR